jgi:O-antigen/teichoic acid export membrane protein
VAAFALHVVGARVLSVDSYGTFGFGWTLAGVVTLIAALGYPNLVLRQAAQVGAASHLAATKGLVVEAARRVGTASGLATLALLTCGAVAYASTTGLASGFLVAAALMPFMPLGLVRGRFSRGLGGVACSVVPEEVLRPVAVAVVLAVLATALSPDPGGAWIAIGSSLACAVCLGLGLVCVVRELPAGWPGTAGIHQPGAWRAARRPMLAASVLQEAASRADLLLLGLLAGVAAVAQFSVCTRLALLNVFVLRVVDSYYSPRLAAAYGAGTPRDALAILRRASLVSTGGALPVAGVMLVWPGELLSLFGADYEAGTFVLRALAVGQLINAATGPVGYALLMSGQERAFARITAGALALAIASHSVVIPLFGIEGAAVVSAVVIGTQNVIMRAVFQRRMPGRV